MICRHSNRREALHVFDGCEVLAERELHRLPEVVTTLGMTGRAEVAIYPVGNDSTDMVVRLRPPNQWKTVHDFDDLSQVIKDRIESRVPNRPLNGASP